MKYDDIPGEVLREYCRILKQYPVKLRTKEVTIRAWINAKNAIKIKFHSEQPLPVKSFKHTENPFFSFFDEPMASPYLH